jgi:hypothetical protein
VEEISTLRELDRRIASGENLTGWKQAEIRETGTPEAPFALDGFQSVFTAGDLGAIRAAATHPLRITHEAGIKIGTDLPQPLGTAPPAPVTVNPINTPAQFGGPSGLGTMGGGGSLEIGIRSTGGSTGPVLEAFIVNYGTSVHLTGTGMVLEPVPPAEARQHDARFAAFLKSVRAGGIMPSPAQVVPPDGGTRNHGPSASETEAWAPAPAPGRVVRLVLDACCLEFLNAVPAAGMVFRIAGQAKQRAAERLRGILGASERLRQLGRLRADGNPESYFHSVR